ncbi:hypothetical protein FNV43_RR23959 [Rhamnella rubrinervis]|uniref:Uncharacterized protein n=1 Tax=Rhamnella rubrinervis TaxID=2594499 RepID=A0A8K0DKL8_9ROSA|nr:hypothetical protein FNV43_RR23959 [Rhamnella rubrinervis]
MLASILHGLNYVKNESSEIGEHVNVHVKDLIENYMRLGMARNVAVDTASKIAEIEPLFADTNLPIGNPAIQQPPIPSDPTADQSNLPRSATGNPAIRHGHSASEMESEIGWTFDYGLNSLFDDSIPEWLGLDDDDPENSTRILPSHPAVELSNLPDFTDFGSFHSSQFSDDSSLQSDKVNLKRSKSLPILRSETTASPI